nr:hypothetical protein Iba_chr09cCG4010 [Ipomoea batatas]
MNLSEHILQYLSQNPAYDVAFLNNLGAILVPVNDNCEKNVLKAFVMLWCRRNGTELMMKQQNVSSVFEFVLGGGRGIFMKRNRSLWCVYQNLRKIVPANVTSQSLKDCSNEISHAPRLTKEMEVIFLSLALRRPISMKLHWFIIANVRESQEMNMDEDNQSQKQATTYESLHHREDLLP